MKNTNFFHRALVYLKSLIHLSDEIDYENASASIRKNIAFKGTNVFILACAIIIASVGLNVNSIPVIIGAMLVSPVMAQMGLMPIFTKSLLQSSSRTSGISST